MDQLFDILLRTGEIFILLLGAVGLVGSFVLLFSPGMIRAVGNWFDKYVNVDGTVTGLNHYVRIDKFIYRHNILFGICLTAGSVYVLFFLFFQLPSAQCENIVFDMLKVAFIWVGKDVKTA